MRSEREILARNMKRRGIELICCADRQEALSYILGRIQAGASVCWGGSVTLREIGLTEAFINGPYAVIDRAAAKNGDELRRVFASCMLADYFFCSANAITEAGELVNIDGNGNRVACLAYGPKKVFVIAGKNKLVGSVQEGIERVRTIAAPKNAVRGGYKTGCLREGICVDCYLPECMCGQILITRFNRIPGRINVILIEEDLGY